MTEVKRLERRGDGGEARVFYLFLSLSLSRFSSFVRLPAEIYDETRTHSPTSFVWFVLLSFSFPPLYFSDDTNNYASVGKMRVKRKHG